MSSHGLLVGASLKMYFSHERTLAWVRRVAEITARHSAVQSGQVTPFVIPQYPSIPASFEESRSTGLHLGAQDLAMADDGAFTGEVSGSVLAEIGCAFVEVGHAERRRMFGETDDVVAFKVDAALRNSLIPIICIGEPEKGSTTSAVMECRRQLDAALRIARAEHRNLTVVIAYEPVWAIGAAHPAGIEHIRFVCGALREYAQTYVSPGARVIYGGSAGPGLLAAVAPSVDGVFLGRMVHDPESFAAVLDEAASI